MVYLHIKENVKNKMKGRGEKTIETRQTKQKGRIVLGRKRNAKATIKLKDKSI